MSERPRPRAPRHPATAVVKGQFTRIGHIPGGGQPLLREGGPISYDARPELKVLLQKWLMASPLYCGPHVLLSATDIGNTTPACSSSTCDRHKTIFSHNIFQLPFCNGLAAFNRFLWRARFTPGKRACTFLGARLMSGRPHQRAHRHPAAEGLGVRPCPVNGGRLLRFEENVSSRVLACRRMSGHFAHQKRRPPRILQ